MNIEGLNFIIDQIMGHLAVFRPVDGIMHKKAEYPSKYPAPCKLRIWENKDRFHLRGKDSSGKDIVITVRCSPLTDKGLQKTRPKRYKRYRNFQERNLEHKNLIVVDQSNVKDTKDDLLLLAGIYLARDEIINQADAYVLYEKYMQEHFHKIWKEERAAPIDAFYKYLLPNFKIPTNATALKSYLGLIEKKELASFKKPKGVLSDDQRSRCLKEEDMLDYGGRFLYALDSTVYKWIKSGKIKGVKRKGWRYKYPSNFNEQVKQLVEEKKERQNLALLARHQTPKGKKIKSTQRKFQRWRRKGLSLQEIARKAGLTNS